MIARVWEGVVSPERADAYGEYLRGALGVQDYRNTPGNQGVTLLRRDEARRVTFLLVSLWTSREAIAAYAGPDIERARYHPFDLECLLDPTPTVRHFEVLEHVPAEAR
jgi:heme-degrading monooxygenase HmoA